MDLVGFSVDGSSQNDNSIRSNITNVIRRTQTWHLSILLWKIQLQIPQTHIQIQNTAEFHVRVLKFIFNFKFKLNFRSNCSRTKIRFAILTVVHAGKMRKDWKSMAKTRITSASSKCLQVGPEHQVAVIVTQCHVHCSSQRTHHLEAHNLVQISTSNLPKLGLNVLGLRRDSCLLPLYPRH